MKRILFLTLALLSFSTSSIAQLRIEKRHYTKGWYISFTDHSKKKSKNADENVLPAIEKPAAQQPDAPIEKEKVMEKPAEQLQEKSKALVGKYEQKIRKQTEKIKTIRTEKKPAALPVNTQPTLQTHAFTTRAHSKATLSASPDESYWSIFAPIGNFFKIFFIVLAIIGIAALLVALISGIVAFIANPSWMGLLAVLLVIFCFIPL